MVTYERLHEVLNYNQDTGIFTWKETRNQFAVAGQEAGWKTSEGYIFVMIDKRSYAAHRLAWLYVHGYFPENQIDHINRIKDANWISNLREVSMRCNIRNAKTPTTNTSGVKGVSWDNQLGKWRAQITTGEGKRHPGFYEDFDEAVCARLAAEQCLNWEGCDSTSDAYRYVQAWRSL